MTAPELSAEERAVVERFEAAPVIEEAWESEVERVARAIAHHLDESPEDWTLQGLARAALAARRPHTEAEEAVRRVAEVAAQYETHVAACKAEGLDFGDLEAAAMDIRRALAGDAAVEGGCMTEGCDCAEADR